MTAEVAILNRRGVALAADSAVTIRAGDSSKVFNSANKLLMLGEDQPVAVMVYGNADFIGIPWETILKEFRRMHGTEVHPNLSDYADALLSFVGTFVAGITNADERTNDSLTPVVNMLYRLRDNIREKIGRHISSGESRTLRSLMILAAREISAFSEIFGGSEYLESFTEADTRRFVIDNRGKLDELIDDVFEPRLLSNESRRKLRRSIGHLLFREWSDPTASGVVVAGFGSAQVFPSLNEFRLYGLYANRLRYSRASPLDIDTNNGSIVKGFAQGDMISTFMEGADPSFLAYGSTFLRRALADLPSAIMAGLKVSKKTEEMIRSNAERLATGISATVEDGLFDYRSQNHVGPVLDTVALMPLDEMANLARALVNLTSLKRRTQMVEESVGGPVDVALVSKGDGFVWVDRKHYFDPALNPRFLARYAKPSTTGSTDE